THPPGLEAAAGGRRRRGSAASAAPPPEVGGWAPATACRRWPPVPVVRTGAGPDRLPAVVRERSVALGHLLQVVLALDRGAEPVAGVHQLGGQPLGHGLLSALTGVPDDPADGEGRGPPG